jgi:hypothetical protein
MLAPGRGPRDRACRFSREALLLAAADQAIDQALGPRSPASPPGAKAPADRDQVQKARVPIRIWQIGFRLWRTVVSFWIDLSYFARPALTRIYWAKRSRNSQLASAGPAHELDRRETPNSRAGAFKAPRLSSLRSGGSSHSQYHALGVLRDCGRWNTTDRLTALEIWLLFQRECG